MNAMTTPTLIPLKNAGESVTMGVDSCQLMTVGKYPEVEFIGNDGSQTIAVRVNKTSADKQLARLSLTYESAAGKILTLSRAHNPSDATKPYWNINLAGTMPTKSNGSPPVQRAAELPDEPPPIEEAYGAPKTIRASDEARPFLDPFDKLAKLHKQCFIHATDLGDLGRENGWELDSAAISALTAQLFIAATNR